MRAEAGRLAMATPTSGTITFVFTDIEGSTRLWEQFADAIKVTVARHDGIKFDSKRLLPLFNFTVQTQSGRCELIWPKEVATTKLVYPKPDWSK